jgi:hypothetical protein
MSKHLQSRSGSRELPGVHPANHKTQKQHILDLLLAACGGEVPLAEIMLCAAQYNHQIYKLRQHGYKILNRTETRNGVLHSWYRLESAPPELAPEPSRKKSARVDPPNTPPAPSQSQPKPSPSTPSQTLSLFPEMAAPVQQPQRAVWRDPEMNAVKHG